jgi:ABC-2 type transport system ATP-binding protein
LAAVIQYLSSAVIAVDEIGLRRPTLDEVFLAVTSAGTGAAAATGAGAGTGAGK